LAYFRQGSGLSTESGHDCVPSYYTMAPPQLEPAPAVHPKQ